MRLRQQLHSARYELQPGQKSSLCRENTSRSVSLWNRYYPQCGHRLPKPAESPTPFTGRALRSLYDLLDAERTRIQTETLYVRSTSIIARPLSVCRQLSGFCHETSYRSYCGQPFRCRLFVQTGQGCRDAIGFRLCRPGRGRSANARATGIEVQLAVARSVAAPITATGQLQLNEDKTWHVGAVTEGRIVGVPVHLGESVSAGQILAQMHSHEVHDSRADRRQAVAELDRVKVMAEQAMRVGIGRGVCLH